VWGYELVAMVAMDHLVALTMHEWCGDVKSQKKSNGGIWSFNYSNIACTFMARNVTTSNAWVGTITNFMRHEKQRAVDTMMSKPQYLKGGQHFND
jgi:hypothetical protein